ncbi:hypothetical protein N2152v2_002056 [Parachlorella kessleri]
MTELFTPYQHLHQCLQQLYEAAERGESETSNTGPSDHTSLPSLQAAAGRLGLAILEQEEEDIIRLGLLEEQTQAACSLQDVTATYIAVVALHQRLLSLLQLSLQAYSAVLEGIQRQPEAEWTPYLHSLLEEPFCSAEVTRSLLRRAERRARTLAQQLATPMQSWNDGSAGESACAAEGCCMCEQPEVSSAVAALAVTTVAPPSEPQGTFEMGAVPRPEGPKTPIPEASATTLVHR